MFTPKLEVITGCMFSGKTEELIRRLKRARIAGIEVKTFKPKYDTRIDDQIKSRNGDALGAIALSEAGEILDKVDDRHLVVGIDEAQFFNQELVAVTLRLIRMSKRVIVAGLDLDYREQPFETVSALMSLASSIDKLTAVCMKCKLRDATRSQRLIADNTRLIIGDREYEPRCLLCYEPPH